MHLEYNMSCVRKHGGNDMDESNPYGDQTTHFINWVESLNATNSTYNRKKMGTTFETWPTICVSTTNEGNTSKMNCCNRADNMKMC